MAEYIEYDAIEKFRDEITDKFIKLCNGNDFNKLTLLKICDTLDTIYEKYSILPTADVTEVRHSKWLTWEEQFPNRKPSKNKSLGVFCNNCRNHSDNITDYCPNCGAKMDGKAGDEV